MLPGTTSVCQRSLRASDEPEATHLDHRPYDPETCDPVAGSNIPRAASSFPDDGSWPGLLPRLHPSFAMPEVDPLQWGRDPTPSRSPFAELPWSESDTDNLMSPSGHDSAASVAEQPGYLANASTTPTVFYRQVTRPFTGTQHFIALTKDAPAIRLSPSGSVAAGVTANDTSFVRDLGKRAIAKLTPPNRKRTGRVSSQRNATSNVTPESLRRAATTASKRMTKRRTETPPPPLRLYYGPNDSDDPAGGLPRAYYDNDKRHLLWEQAPDFVANMHCSRDCGVGPIEVKALIAKQMSQVRVFSCGKSCHKLAFADGKSSVGAYTVCTRDIHQPDRSDPFRRPPVYYVGGGVWRPCCRSCRRQPQTKRSAPSDQSPSPSELAGR